MELSDSFEVSHPISMVWGVLTDVERIAPCLPGAQLTGAEGDDFHGIVKVKVGPVTSQYKGKASFEEFDEAAHRAVISASGRDTRGAGNASAKITVELESTDSASTRVSVHTNLTITGKVAQFGRGVMADVSRKLMGQFAQNLAALIDEADPGTTEAGDAQASEDGTADDPAEAQPPAADTAAADPAPADTATVDAADDEVEAVDTAPADTATVDAADDEVEAVDLLAVAGGSVMKRLVPVLVGVAVIVIVLLIVF